MFKNTLHIFKLCVHCVYMYECEKCGYKTNRRNVLERHHNRKIPCDSKKNQIDNKDVCKPCCDSKLSATKEEFVCSKCNKHLSCKYSLKRHEAKCKGSHSLCCHLCKTEFQTRQQKYKHKQRCIMIEPLRANKKLRDFGDEKCEHFEKDNSIIQRMKKYGKDGVYGLPKILNEIHYGKHLCNMNVIKPNEYGKKMMIWVDGEWEYKEFNDIHDHFVRSIETYIIAFNNVRKKLKVKFVEKKERSILKIFFEIFIELGGTIPSDLYEELELHKKEFCIQDHPNIYNKYANSAMFFLYTRTGLNFKKYNGQFLLKKGLIHLEGVPPLLRV